MEPLIYALASGQAFTENQGQLGRLIEAEEIEALYRELGRLPKRWQATLDGRFVRGETFRAIGRRLKITPARAREIQMQALSRLGWKLQGRLGLLSRRGWWGVT